MAFFVFAVCCPSVKVRDFFMRNNTRKILALLPVFVLIAAAFTTSVFAAGDGETVGGFYNTAWALLPPVIAIALALITKEVYSSLFIGIVMGGLLYANAAIHDKKQLTSTDSAPLSRQSYGSYPHARVQSP